MSLTINTKGDIFNHDHHVSTLEVEAMIKRWEGKIADAKAVLKLSESIVNPVVDTDEPAPADDTPVIPSEPAAPETAPTEQVAPQPIFTPSPEPTQEPAAPVINQQPEVQPTQPTVLG